MEADAVIDDPDPLTRRFQQAVPGFAIRVVHHVIEQRHAHERGRVFGHQREVMLLGIVFDVELHRADPFRTVALHRRRHQRPAERFAQLVRRDLTPP